MRVELGLQEVGAVDGEQRLALLHVIADGGEQRDDLALIGREDLRLHVLVEVDAADGLLFNRKLAVFDRLDLHRSELGIRQIDAVAWLCAAARGASALAVAPVSAFGRTPDGHAQ